MTALSDGRGGQGAFALVLIAWAIVGAGILRHPVYVSHDSLSNYAHVWYVADRIRDHHVVPLRMPPLARGGAYAFPYGFVPWLSAAVAWMIVGEWAVTLWLVLGGAALGVALLWALPELGRGWWAAAALVSPPFVLSVIDGQLPFLWGAALLVAGIGCWRRDRRVLATILVALGQATHPAIVAPMGLIVVAAWWRYERDRRALLVHYVICLVLTIPAALLVLTSPVAHDTPLGATLWAFASTIDVRLLVVAVPVALLFLARRCPHWGPLAFAVVLVMNLVLMAPLDSRYAWGALGRNESSAALEFLSSPHFDPNATYRLLRQGDGKVALYQLLRAGGRLDSEMFPESMGQRSFGDADSYASFLKGRRVDAVWIWTSYDDEAHTDEHAILDELAADGSACRRGLVGVRVLRRTPSDTVYQMDRDCPPAP